MSVSNSCQQYVRQQNKPKKDNTASKIEEIISDGDKKFTKCGKKISVKDPEKRFCSNHRRCVYPGSGLPEKVIIKPEPEKLRDFPTFSISCIEFYE